MASESERWPALTRPGWESTRDALQLSMQIVGKVALALSPPVNHYWDVAFLPTARGLRTYPLSSDGSTVDAEFDLLSHDLVLRSGDGSERRIALGNRSIASFYGDVLGALHAFDLDVRVHPYPVEMAFQTRFDEDTADRPYDAAWATAFFRAVSSAAHVFEEYRAGFLGKASPVHFFWGSFDLTTSRYSGRRAPPHPGGPNVPLRVMREAYSHEVASVGFWPGGAGYPEAAFYAYCYPEPARYAETTVLPSAAFYDGTMGEFVLPYDSVRRSGNPERELLTFLRSTWVAAAELGRWDRAALERRAPAAAPAMPATVVPTMH